MRAEIELENQERNTREVLVVGAGLAGISAAIYLGRAQRDTLVVDSGCSLARWEPAGCVTPANCQMIIAAGQGAAAAQAINRDLFHESLRAHSLRKIREHQLRTDRIQSKQFSKKE